MRARATSIPKAGEMLIQMALSFLMRRFAENELVWLLMSESTETFAPNHCIGASAICMARERLSELEIPVPIMPVVWLTGAFVIVFLARQELAETSNEIKKMFTKYFLSK